MGRRRSELKTPGLLEPLEAFFDDEDAAEDD